jgi:hypothetical protein
MGMCAKEIFKDYYGKQMDKVREQVSDFIYL